RPSARVARERRGGAARLEPRPAREHRQRRVGERARRLPLASEAAGPARFPRGARQGRQRTGRERAQEGPAPAQEMGRYRWLILAAGTLSATSLSAVQIGISAIAPALRARFGLSLSEIGVVLGATNAGMTLTLLAWGIISDRIGERLSIVIGLTGAALALAAAATVKSFAALVTALIATGAFGASVNSASGRAVMHWFASDGR